MDTWLPLLAVAACVARLILDARPKPKSRRIELDVRHLVRPADLRRRDEEARLAHQLSATP